MEKNFFVALFLKEETRESGRGVEKGRYSRWDLGGKRKNMNFRAKRKKEKGKILRSFVDVCGRLFCAEYFTPQRYFLNKKWELKVSGKCFHPHTLSSDNEHNEEKVFLPRRWEDENLSFLANWVVSKIIKKTRGGKTPYYASFFASEVNSSPFLFRLPPSPDRSTDQKNNARRIPKWRPNAGPKKKKEYIGERKGRSACKIRSRVIGGENRPWCDCLHPIPRAETV